MPIHVQNQEILFFSSSPPIFLPYSLALTVPFFLSSVQKDEVSLGVLASCTANVTIQNHMEKREGGKKTGNSLEWLVSLSLTPPQSTCFCLLFRDLGCFFCILSGVFNSFFF